MLQLHGNNKLHLHKFTNLTEFRLYTFTTELHRKQKATNIQNMAEFVTDDLTIFR